MKATPGAVCGLGAPKQEFWLEEHRDALKPALRVGLGGSFDVLAGKMERAPKWMQEAPWNGCSGCTNSPAVWDG